MIREQDDLSHATVRLYDGKGEASPDGQCRHKSHVPHFVFEIGYSEEADSLQNSARDYIEGTDDIKTVVTVNTAYNSKERSKARLRKQRQRRDHTPLELGAASLEAPQSVGDEQDQAGVDDPKPIDRSATIFLHRGESIVLRDATFRDRHGAAQDGTLTLSLDDFIPVQGLTDCTYHGSPYQG